MTRIEKAEIAQVIKITLVIGDDTPDDPVLQIDQYWSMDGRLLSEVPLAREEMTRTLGERRHDNGAGDLYDS